MMLIRFVRVFNPRASAHQLKNSISGPNYWDERPACRKLNYVFSLVTVKAQSRAHIRSSNVRNERKNRLHTGNGSDAIIEFAPRTIR
jgi:hypothetical protein